MSNYPDAITYHQMLSETEGLIQYHEMQLQKVSRELQLLKNDQQWIVYGALSSFLLNCILIGIVVSMIFKSKSTTKKPSQ